MICCCHLLASLRMLLCIIEAIEVEHFSIVRCAMLWSCSVASPYQPSIALILSTSPSLSSTFRNSKRIFKDGVEKRDPFWGHLTISTLWSGSMRNLKNIFLSSDGCLSQLTSSYRPIVSVSLKFFRSCSIPPMPLNTFEMLANEFSRDDEL